MKKLTIVSIFLLFINGFLLAQTRHISGVVYNAETKAPIPDINITVRGTPIVTITDENGSFALSVPDSISNIEFSGFPGMNIAEIKIIGHDVFHLYLTPDNEDLFSLSLEELMKIPVTSASKFAESVNETPATVLVITAEDIRRRGYLTMIELLEDLPGLDVTNSHGEVNVLAYSRGNRTGSMNERIMLMVDGVEHNILYTQQMMIAQDFPLTIIERVEVLYGPASAVYGPNAFSGVINVITKKTTGLEAFDDVDILLGGGAFNTQMADVSYRTQQGDLGLSVTYRRFRSDRFDMSDSPGFFKEGEIIGNPDVWGPYAEKYDEFDNKCDNHSLFTKLSYKDFEIGFNRLVTRQGNGASYPYDKTLPTTNWRMFRNIFYGRINKSLTDKLTFSTLATYQRGGTGPDATWAQGWNEGDTWDTQRTVEFLSWKYISERWGFFQDVVVTPIKQITFSGGVKYASTNYQKSYEHGRSDQTIWMPGEQWDEVENLYPIPYTNTHTPGNTFDDYEWGVYAQTKISLSDRKFNIVAGVRYDDNSIYGEVFNPRIGLTYAFTQNLWFKLNYGEAFQAPAPRNLYGNWGGLSVNENLDPEKIKAIDGSVVLTKTNLRVDVTAFYNFVTNSVLQGENLPDKTMYGVEVKLDYYLPEVSHQLSQLRLHSNFSLINAEYAQARTAYRTSTRIGDIAPIKANIVFSGLLFKKLGFFVRANYVGKRNTVVTNPVESTEQYFVLNAGLQYEQLFGYEGLSVFFNAYNLLDAEYYHPGWDDAGAGEDISRPSLTWYCSRMPQPPRNFMTGVRLSF